MANTKGKNQPLDALDLLDIRSDLTEEELMVKDSVARFESLYFPDGNASVPRLLVAKLIPAVTIDDADFTNISNSHFDYKMLDKSEHSIRLRLNKRIQFD